MSNFIIDIIDSQTNIIEIETSFVENVNNIEIERYETYNLEIINTEKILPSDFPNTFQMSQIVGNLPLNRVSGLNEYLNTYTFDCGTP
jgi:16S rRNA A1518/A1519 N6-dimethyltransferase RsmA/KsgA/DIM1 with predicted DNA glycosylase/AP lyase activity